MNHKMEKRGNMYHGLILHTIDRYRLPNCRQFLDEENEGKIDFRKNMKNLKKT